ncbi:hypothetical protein ACNGEM_07525 [Campylobacter coli]
MNKKFCDKQYNNYTLNDNSHCPYDEGPFGIEYVIVMTTVMAVVLVIEYFSR